MAVAGRNYTGSEEEGNRTEDRQSTQRQETKLVYWINGRKLIKVIKQDVERFQHNLSYHKAGFGFLVFFSLTLMWYGLWELIKVTPVINNPWVAVASGLALLALTGGVYKLWS